MTRDQAEALIAAIVALSEPLGTVDIALGGIHDKIERTSLKRNFANALSSLNDVTTAVIGQYPDLNPYIERRL